MQVQYQRDQSFLYHSSIMAPMTLTLLAGLTGLALANPPPYSSRNTTYQNPIIPGFHPDPSCIFVREWDNTFFCASSSFIAFPGVCLDHSKLAQLTLTSRPADANPR